MTPLLTDDQRQALDVQGGSPIYVVDLVTNARYVLLRADLFERFKAIFEEEFDPRETYAFVDRVMADDDRDETRRSCADIPQ
ncbi:MAG: hypothetical protein ACP5XB_18060 [Isosphaeraceae bacterium]